MQSVLNELAAHKPRDGGRESKQQMAQACCIFSHQQTLCQPTILSRGYYITVTVTTQGQMSGASLVTARNARLSSTCCARLARGNRLMGARCEVVANGDVL